MRKRKQSSGAPETVLAEPGKSGGDLRDSELLSEGSQFEQGWNDSCETQAANHSFSGSKFPSGISLEHLGLLNNFLAGLRYLEESSAPKEKSCPTFALPLTRENAEVLVDAFLAKLWRRVPLKPKPGSKGEQCPFSGLNRNYHLHVRRNGRCYAYDTTSHRYRTVRTDNRDIAERLIAAMNQANDVPLLNRAMARIYAAGASPELMTRTWAEVMEAYALKSVPSTRKRVERAFRSEPFKVLRKMRVNETDASAFFAVLNHKCAGNAANHFLRRLQNFAWAMRWLFEPIIPSPEWPKVKKKITHAISAAEHAKIIASEQNLEHRLYYQMLWETGGSQSDIANLTWDRVDKESNTVVFYRDKMNEREEGGEIMGLSVLAIGPRIQSILEQCPPSGSLFPTFRKWTSGHRTTEFARRCEIAGIKDRQLKGYRYAWAERARAAGMPEREAMNHLGHKSRAVHRAYAANARAVTLPLEHYEQLKADKIVAFQKEQIAAS